MNLFNKRLKYINVDDLHYDISEVMSLQLPFMYLQSPREPGKTSSVIRMLYRAWYERDYRFVYLKRQQVTLSDSLISDLSTELNKFLPEEDQIKFIFQKGKMKDGVCDIYVYPKNDDISVFKCDIDHLFFRCISLNIPADRFKGMTIPNLWMTWFDEFIINKEWGEKYLPAEYDKYRELYNTLKRSRPKEWIIKERPLLGIWTGNCYSCFNPYYSALGANVKAMIPGTMIKGKNYVIQFIKLKDELRDKLLRENPLYEFDDSYTKYALEGKAYLDDNIKLCEVQPKGYKLFYTFRIHNTLLGVYRTYNCEVNDQLNDIFWIQVLDNTVRPTVVFNPLHINGQSRMQTNKEFGKFQMLCRCFRNYQVLFKDVNAYYNFLEVYELIS